MNVTSEYLAGSTEPWTVDIIAAVIYAKKPSVVIETGTFEGRGTVKLLQAMASYADERMSRLYTVEFDVARMNEAWPRFEPYMGLVDVQGVTGDALMFLRTFTGQADVIFIDDDHTAAHVRDELEAAWNILRPGGVIFLHDVVGTFGLDTVVRNAGGVILDLPRLHISGGLGIVTK